MVNTEPNVLFYCDVYDQDKQAFIYEDKDTYRLIYASKKDFDLMITQDKQETRTKHSTKTTEEESSEYFEIDFKDGGYIHRISYAMHNGRADGSLNIIKDGVKISTLYCVRATTLFNPKQ